jgi:hypothetical protein
MTRIGIGMTCSKCGGKEWCYRNLVEKPELKKPHGWPQLNERIILNRMFIKGVGSMYRIYMALIIKDGQIE